VGDHLDPVAGSTVGGRTAYTLWGEIASQLGDDAWAAVAGHDAARTAPGTGAIRKMLDGGPAIIVIDELAQHLHSCAKAGRSDIRNQAEQVAPFLKNLSEEVAGRDDVAVVVTLASANDT
jgi:predicted AAA+ superfamily ATPase